MTHPTSLIKQPFSPLFVLLLALHPQFVVGLLLTEFRSQSSAAACRIAPGLAAVLLSPLALLYLFCSQGLLLCLDWCKDFQRASASDLLALTSIS